MGQETRNRPRGKFESQHEDIIKMYGDKLPAPDKKVAIITVVPAYCELYNDNFWRMLNSLALQRVAKHGKKVEFEMLYVVNNVQEQSINRDENYKENQQTLVLIRALQTASFWLREGETHDKILAQALPELEKVEATAWEREVFMRAVRAEVKLYGIDMSSFENSVSKNNIENRRGVARNIGGHIAYERFMHSDTKNHGLIDFLDADSFPAKVYYSELALHGAQSSAESFSKPLIARNPDIPKFETTEPEVKLAALLGYIRLALVSRERYLVGHIKQYWHGPAIAVRPETFKAVGGYVLDTVSEDYQFANNVARKTNKEPTMLPHVEINLSYRGRPNAVDGGTLNEIGKDDQGLEWLKQGLDPRNNIVEVRPEGYRVFSSLKTLLEKDIQYGSNKIYKTIRAQEFVKERSLRETQQNILKRLIHTAVKWKTTQEIKETFGLRYRDFMDANPILLEAIQTAKSICADEMKLRELGVEKSSSFEKTLWSFFEKYLPEYFAPILHNEPKYDYLQKQLRQANLGIYNARDIIHLAKAIYHYQSIKQHVQ